MHRGTNPIRVFCSGTFCFDYTKSGYHTLVEKDYRARLLGNAQKLLYSVKNVYISDRIKYIGPFYFETEDMEGSSIIQTEQQMLIDCTDAIFIFDEAACPGTIAELMLAASLNKRLHIFYVTYGEESETESILHTPCWYPILLAQKINSKETKLFECSNRKDSEDKAINYIKSQL